MSISLLRVRSLFLILSWAAAMALRSRLSTFLGWWEWQKPSSVAGARQGRGGSLKDLP
jgi:hypothetical protein